MLTCGSFNSGARSRRCHIPGGGVQRLLQYQAIGGDGSNDNSLVAVHLEPHLVNGRRGVAPTGLRAGRE